MSATPVQNVDHFWSVPTQTLLETLGSGKDGLTTQASDEIRTRVGANLYNPVRKESIIDGFLGQLKSPIILLLSGAAILSFALGDAVNAAIILTIILASAGLSFAQEYSANKAVAKLLDLVQVKVSVLRDGKPTDILSAEVVPGDVIELSAGSIIPADGLILEGNNLFVEQAALTGESFPSEKQPGTVAEDSEASTRTNTVFAGTHVFSGDGKMLSVKTGRSTEFGSVIEHMAAKAPETDFQRGVRKFGQLLLDISIILTLSVFGINVFLHKPVLDSFMFALALAVGVTPQLLPAIISVNLSHGVREIAKAKVIVKRLSSIENFGSMNLLCSDKTGTLTLGVVQIQSAVDVNGQDSAAVLRLARLNASYQNGFRNPIDEALVAGGPFTEAKLSLVGEVPYEFVRKRLSVLLADDKEVTIVTKGALDPILAVCQTVRVGEATAPLAEWSEKIQAQFVSFSNEGMRVLGIASKSISAKPEKVNPALEVEMCFEGLLILGDPLRPGAIEAIEKLKVLGIELKVITGDNHLAAQHLGSSIGMKNPRVLRGQDIEHLTDTALVARARRANIFAEVEPNHKERLIIALKRANFVVGYIGDGINDGSALHAADVGISVANAVPVAKEAADMVMLESGLGVLVEAVNQGRRTFANTLKYVYMASSANLGNMFSMAGSSLFLPFLPLLPKQVLLNNLLSDLPEMMIAGDSVDSEMVAHPRRWNMKFITLFMIVFGAINSLSDYATFLFLILINARPAEFRTAWFIENILSATLAVLVVRTRRPFYKSPVSEPLLWAIVATIIIALFLPWTPVGRILGFVPIHISILLPIWGIVVGYIITIEIAKYFFYKRFRNP